MLTLTCVYASFLEESGSNIYTHIHIYPVDISNDDDYDNDEVATS